MDETNANEKVVDRLIQCINDRRTEVMDELFHDDAVMHWPQSGEVVRGAENRSTVTKPALVARTRTLIDLP